MFRFWRRTWCCAIAFVAANSWPDRFLKAVNSLSILVWSGPYLTAEASVCRKIHSRELAVHGHESISQWLSLRDSRWLSASHCAFCEDHDDNYATLERTTSERTTSLEAIRRASI